jgi:hypothetical protein
MKKAFLFALLLIAASFLVAGTFLLFFVIDLSKCEDILEKEILSPNGKNRAFIYSRSCNATVPLTTRISINDNSKKELTDADNVLATKPEFIYGLYWLNENTMVVIGEQEYFISRTDNLKGIKIKYVKKDKGKNNVFWLKK